MGATNPIRAIMTCVNYADILHLTLPKNKKHFAEIAVVTSSGDISSARVAREHGAQVIITDLFYADGAAFAKWRALEYGLDLFRRYGCLCIMDADIVWPDVIPDWEVKQGHLYTPLRRMMYDVSSMLNQGIPPEKEWGKFPIHKNTSEWAGYSQIYWADDHHLGKPPWHDTRWVHAGGGDSELQDKWPRACKIRPPFECLHLGEPGANWHGRATAYLDGTVPPDAEAKREAVRRIWTGRAARRGDPARKYEGEKLDSP